MPQTNKLAVLYIEEADKLFKEFYINNFYRVKDFANVYLNDEFMSENIAQDIFIRIYERREQFKTDDSLLPYLYSATKNRCLNELRRRKTVHTYVEDSAYRFRTDLSLESLDSQDLSENDISLLNETYWKTLDSLPESTRETFLLHRENGLKYQDIADIYGVSIKTIEYRISFALKKLRIALSGIFSLILFVSSWIFGA